MRRLTTLLLLAALTLMVAAEASYHNARYGFSVKIPQGFSRGEEPANGDGCILTSSDGRAQVRLYGSNNIENLTLKQAHQRALQELPGKPAYQASGKKWFVVSWKYEGTIHYRKTFVGPGSTDTLWFQYPEPLAKKYNPVTKAFEASFRPGDLSKSH